MSDVWPMAQRQLDAYIVCHRRTNVKIILTGAGLPDVLWYWWVRNWANELLWRTLSGRQNLADIEAFYEFGDRIDRVLRLSAPPSNPPDPYEAEFTYYDQPLMVDGGRGNCRAEPFASFGYQAEDQRGFLPVAFPRSPTAPITIAPRLSSEQFLAWAGFLASPELLTSQQIHELGHVGWSNVGVGGWCSVHTHIGECITVATILINWIRDAIVHVSNELKIAVHSVPRDQPFRESLNVVSGWLERARTVSANQDRATIQNQKSPAVTNTMRAEQQAIPTSPETNKQRGLVVIDYDNFSPFTLPPCNWELDLEAPEVVTPTHVNNLRDLVGQFRSFARAYHADVADVPNDVTARYFQVQIELNVDRFRQGMQANPWFDQLQTVLRLQFDSHPTPASVNQLV